MKVYGVTGWKNTGKTWLVARLVTEFTARGLSVSTIKHAHHDLDLDTQGSDSHRHREAGAQEVLLASPSRTAILREMRDRPEPTLEDLCARLAPVDLVLVEGYKRLPHPKIETYRAGTGEAPRAGGDASIRAVATDVALGDPGKPVFDLDDVAGIADFIAGEVGL